MSMSLWLLMISVMIWRISAESSTDNTLILLIVNPYLAHTPSDHAA